MILDFLLAILPPIFSVPIFFHLSRLYIHTHIHAFMGRGGGASEEPVEISLWWGGEDKGGEQKSETM
jgi:hypothetical protein